jgi:RNA polymerase-interacting CarD/CdnL/TRCF family regulator
MSRGESFKVVQKNADKRFFRKTLDTFKVCVIFICIQRESQKTLRNSNRKRAEKWSSSSSGSSLELSSAISDLSTLER